MPAGLEHANFTVSDPHATAAWMQDVFGWHIRWSGAAINDGHTIHIGTDDAYVAIYAPKDIAGHIPRSYDRVGALNHIGVVVDDLDATESAVRAAGFTPHNHADYEPGRRFYFEDTDGIEYEVVAYA